MSRVIGRASVISSRCKSLTTISNGNIATPRLRRAACAMTSRSVKLCAVCFGCSVSPLSSTQGWPAISAGRARKSGLEIDLSNPRSRINPFIRAKAVGNRPEPFRDKTGVGEWADPKSQVDIVAKEVQHDVGRCHLKRHIRILFREIQQPRANRRACSQRRCSDADALASGAVGKARDTL